MLWPDKSHLGKEMWILPPEFRRDTALVAGRHSGRSLRNGSHLVHSQEAERDEWLISVCHPPPWCLPWDGLPTFRVGLPPQLNFSGNTLNIHPEFCLLGDSKSFVVMIRVNYCTLIKTGHLHRASRIPLIKEMYFSWNMWPSLFCRGDKHPTVCLEMSFSWQETFIAWKMYTYNTLYSFFCMLFYPPLQIKMYLIH